jgi:uncharacterized protein YqfA (UPF0365 family)
MPSPGTIVLIIACVFCLYALVVLVQYILLWRSGRSVGAELGLGGLFAMRMRKVNPRVVIGAYVVARNAGVDVAIDDIERHLSHGGRVENVIEAVRLAGSKQLRVTWRGLCQQDLNGEDVVEMIRKRLEAAERSKKRSSEAKNG